MSDRNSSPHKDMKKTLRKEALSRRDALTTEYRVEASLRIADLARTQMSVERGEIISGFWPIRSEVDLRPLLFSVRERGARLCLPVILDRETIIFRELVRGAGMIDTGFGTMGPGQEAETLDPHHMLVPLAAFDSRGHRIGYGAGLYDRAIARLHDKGLTPKLTGVAFDVQQVAEVPDQPHDVMLEAILTESGLRRFPLGL